MATSDDRDRRILALHAQGTTRNDIAREIGCAAGTVTKVVYDAGLTFDRTATKAATAARQTDLAARRQSQAERLHGIMDALIVRLEDPQPVTILRGEGGVESEQRVDRLPARDALQLLNGAKALRSTISDLERADNPQARAAASLLTGLAEQLGVSDEAPTT